MAEWVSTVATWQPDWMRSTTRARLHLCRGAREGWPNRVRFLEDEPERAIPPADNTGRLREYINRANRLFRR